MLNRGTLTIRTMLSALIVMSLVATALGTAPASAAPPICSAQQGTDGLDGCMPTPDECATGNFNGRWETGQPGRFVECRGHMDPTTGIGHIDFYSGGDVVAVCGGTIVDDAPIAAGLSVWRDPNLCPGLTTPPGYGVKGRGYNAPVAGQRGAIATESPDASEAAIEVLQTGGNAIDAAVAAVFAVGVTRPEMCGIGGGAFLVYRGVNGEVAALDFRETAPAAVTPDLLEGSGLHTTGTGHRVVGVPGVVAGLAEAHRRYGRSPWASLVDPAIELAETGVPITRVMAPLLETRQGHHIKRLKLFPASDEIFLQDLRRNPYGMEYVPPFPISRRLELTDYANSLRLIRDQGESAFYQGAIADLIIKEMDASRANPIDGNGRNAGLMVHADLAGYRPTWREPLTSTYRDAEIITMPPPTSGGIFTIETLNILEGLLDPAQAPHSSADHMHLFAEAQKIAWADRNKYVADPDFESVPTEAMVSKEYARQRAREIDPRRAQSYSAGNFGTPPAEPTEDDSAGHTTHVAVIDAAGNAVSVTCTIEQVFGSAVVVPGAGFLLNNELFDFSPPGTANEPEPGKRPRSSMSPTIVVREGRPIAAVGGAGGPMIPMAVTLAVSNVVDYDMDLAHAIDAARFREPDCSEAQANDGVCPMWLEDGRILNDVEQELKRRGHRLVRSAGENNEGWSHALLPTEYHPIPILQAVGYDPTTRLYVASSDPRSDCGAAALDRNVVVVQCPQ